MFWRTFSRTTYTLITIIGIGVLSWLALVRPVSGYTASLYPRCTIRTQTCIGAAPETSIKPLYLYTDTLELGRTLNPTQTTGLKNKASTPIDAPSLPVDTYPTVQLSHISYLADENAVAMVITVTLSASSSSDVQVDYFTSDGTAVAGSDYTAVTGTAYIPAGNTTATLILPIHNDNRVEEAEMFTLALSNPAQAHMGYVNLAVLTILDDDEQNQETNLYLPLIQHNVSTNDKGFKRFIYLYPTGQENGR